MNVRRFPPYIEMSKYRPRGGDRLENIIKHNGNNKSAPLASPSRRGQPIILGIIRVVLSATNNRSKILNRTTAEAHWVLLLLFLEPTSFPKTDAIATILDAAIVAAAAAAAEMARNRNKLVFFQAVFVPTTIMLVVTASSETILEPVSSLRDSPVSSVICCRVGVVAVVVVARRGDDGNRIDSVGPQGSPQAVRLPLQATHSHVRVSLLGLRVTRGGKLLQEGTSRRYKKKIFRAKSKISSSTKY